MHDMTLTRSVRLRSAAAIAAAVLGLGAAPQAAPAAPAAPAASVCAVGEFCLWNRANQTGGLYHFAGSDSTLWNDRFENISNSTQVANASVSWWNRGTTAGGPAQVRVFSGSRFTGVHTCAPQGSRGNFGWDPVNRIYWSSQVESYTWRSSC
jgi:hypothetical protein